MIEDDPKLRVELIEKFTELVQKENAILNNATFNGDFSYIQSVEPKLFAAIMAKISADDWGVAISLLKIAYGRALETAVKQAILVDEVLSNYFAHVGNANKPDFIGIRAPVSGFDIDITTNIDTEFHKDPNLRPTYGENLIVIGYERWF